jgi:hypothetical protein
MYSWMYTFLSFLPKIGTKSSAASIGMTNKTVQQMVLERLNHSGAIASSFLHPVSVRLPPDDIVQLDILAKYLGYSGRSHLLRDLISVSLEDLVVETSKALQEDHHVSSQFRAELQSALAS